jgi:hypothetical protein
LVSRIARTVIVVSLKPNAPFSAGRGLYSHRVSNNSFAPISFWGASHGLRPKPAPGFRRAATFTR